MRPNIVIDNDLIEEAFKYSTSRTKKDLIHEALVTFIESKKRMNLMDLKGKIRFSDTYDYKKVRERI
jgi:Arc/MetJ family transcription regulator